MLAQSVPVMRPTPWALAFRQPSVASQCTSSLLCSCLPIPSWPMPICAYCLPWPCLWPLPFAFYCSMASLPMLPIAPCPLPIGSHCPAHCCLLRNGLCPLAPIALPIAPGSLPISSHRPAHCCLLPHVASVLCLPVACHLPLTRPFATTAVTSPHNRQNLPVTLPKALLVFFRQCTASRGARPKPWQG